MDVDQFVSDTIEEACAEQPDLVILHDHVLGGGSPRPAAKRSRSWTGGPTSSSARKVVRSASGAPATEFTGGSTGGHVTTVPDPGAIKSPARFAILSVQPDGEDTTYAVVTVAPDTTVTVTPEISLDVTYQEFVDTGRTGLTMTWPNLARLDR